MKIGLSLLAVGVLPWSQGSNTEEFVTLRGNKAVVHKRTVRPHQTEEAKKPENMVHRDPIVEPHHKHTVKLRGTSKSGKVKEVAVDYDILDSDIHHEHHYHNYHGHHEEETHHTTTEQESETRSRPNQKKPKTTEKSKQPETAETIGHNADSPSRLRQNKKADNPKQTETTLSQQAPVQPESSQGSATQEVSMPEIPRVAVPVQVETPHLESAPEEQQIPVAQPSAQGSTTEEASQRRRGRKPSKRGEHLNLLPHSNADEHFNETLFEQLYNSPFDLYENAIGHKLEEEDSFPVLTMPTWYNVTGVFSAFSKTATPLIFENSQILLDWDSIQSASPVVSNELHQFMADVNFHTNVIIGKSFGKVDTQPFLGLVLTYYQFGVEKNVLVPFAKIEDFFDERYTSHHHILDRDTRNLEIDALHQLLEQKGNHTSQHRLLQLRDTRAEQLENLEIIRFQQLFQVLIRRSFLFSFGYADCLHQDPYGLRACLDETFEDVVHRETTTRGALDEQLFHELEEINRVFHSHVSEACISVQGSGQDPLRTGSCSNIQDLRRFVISTLQ
jgi:hypothetical protein